MDWTQLISSGVVAALVSGGVSWITGNRKLKSDERIAERRAVADITLAEKRFEFDTALAEKRLRLENALADRKKKQDLAEEVLSGFYQVRDMIDAIRSPLSNPTLESKDRPRFENESESEGKMRDTYYVPFARYQERQQAISDLLSRRYRMSAWFGSDADQAFLALNEAINNILHAGRMLISWSTRVRQTDPGLVQAQEEKIWWTGENDPISLKVKEAVEKIEAVCRPILREV